MQTKRDYRNSIDLLPIEAEEDVIWAFDELRRRKRTKEDILTSFNTRLMVKGIKPISKTAFSRATIRAAQQAHRMEEVREVANVMAAKFEDGGDENVTLLVSEMIKMIVFEILENAGNLPVNGKTAEMMMNFASALKSAEQAKKVTADTRKVIEANFKKQADAAIDKVKGITPELKESFRRDLFGLTHG